MNDVVTIRLAKENMKFSAAHFTIFSATERERLHGHNFRVEVDIEAHMLGNGMCFDYGIYKDRVVALCRELNEWTILPTRSEHLRIEEDGAHVFALFDGTRIPFLRADVLLLPIENATLDGFALRFAQAQWAVTPGQSAVLYDGDVCLGGGIIAQVDPAA